MSRLLLYTSPGTDPYRNLALEERLLSTVEAGEVALYLWQNKNTVVIGRNQNPWKECRTALLEQEGGHLARRLSGGGAVYHDLGNLNFTFLMPKGDYDLDRQLAVIQEAAASFGIETQRSGRNDVLAQGRKFSGNAFYKGPTAAYHHGTLLVDVDTEKMGRYLNPSKAKLHAKGVDSVRARVVNLKELAPGITIDALKAALAAAFGRVYGGSVEPVPPERLEEGSVEALRRRYESWQWRYGRDLPFTAAWEGRFPWGGVRLQAQVDAGVLVRVQVYTDAMDAGLAPRLERALTGVPLDPAALEAALAPLDQGPDIAGLLKEL